MPIGQYTYKKSNKWLHLNMKESIIKDKIAKVLKSIEGRKNTKETREHIKRRINRIFKKMKG